MTKEQWQQWVSSRWASQRKRDGHEQLAIMGLGIGGEAGEVQEHIKKFIRDGKPLPNQEFVWELGDVLHYLTRIASEFGVTLEQVMLANIDKLERRERGENVG